MKKLISTIIALLILAPYTQGAYEKTSAVKILSLNTTTKNAIINYDDKDFLLHYKGKCELKEGENAKINVSGELNANGDIIFTDNYYQCQIDQAEEINGTLTLDQVFYGFSLIATDEEGKQYDIYHDARCMSIVRYKGDEVYLYKAGSKIDVADKIYLPRNEGYCSITYIKQRQTLAPSLKKTTEDIQRPTGVSSLTATPRNASVFLRWRAASDNIGVDHYIISSSPYSIDTKEHDAKDMPNQIETKGTSYTVTGLINEEIYFFYVLAVDKAGNMSSDWSPEASATPLSSISKTTTTAPVKNKITISKTSETNTSITFNWTRIAGLSRQTVLLTVNRERDFAFTNWTSNEIKISKSIYRKGKPLKLTVRQYDIRGSMYESSFEFSF